MESLPEEEYHRCARFFWLGHQWVVRYLVAGTFQDIVAQLKQKVQSERLLHTAWP